MDADRRGLSTADAAIEDRRRAGPTARRAPAPRSTPAHQGLGESALSLGECLSALQRDWKDGRHLGAIWQAWPRIAGAQLAAHGQPISLHAGVLTVGAAPGPWLQAIQYNRHQLLGALRGAGFALRDLRLRQLHGEPPRPGTSELQAEEWARHPSRIDVHGLADCSACGRPAPAGEMALWGHCGFCRRDALSTSRSSGPIEP